MASPQIEDGHIDIANDIADYLCRYRISGEEWLVLWAILRKTYGWKKKEDRIALSQFAAMTGLKRQTVLRAINKLSSKKITTVIKKDNQVSSFLGHTKDNITKDNNTPLPPFIPEWVPVKTFNEYQASRSKKLKPASYDRFFKKLKRLCELSRASPEEIFNQSIENGWEGIFELKQQSTRKEGLLVI